MEFAPRLADLFRHVDVTEVGGAPVTDLVPVLGERAIRIVKDPDSFRLGERAWNAGNAVIALGDDDVPARAMDDLREERLAEAVQADLLEHGVRARMTAGGGPRSLAGRHHGVVPDDLDHADVRMDAAEE